MIHTLLSAAYRNRPSSTAKGKKLTQIRRNRPKASHSCLLVGANAPALSWPCPDGFLVTLVVLKLCEHKDCVFCVFTANFI